MKLLGRAVNDVLTEFRGPQVGWNYGGTDPANVEIFVQGTGGVKLQVNTTTIMGSGTNSMSPNPIDVTQIPDPAGWGDVGSEIDQGDGLVVRAVSTPSEDRMWLRIIVSTAGTGVVRYGGRWGKY